MPGWGLMAPTGGSDMASVGESADWTAPSHQVELAYDTADQARRWAHRPRESGPSCRRAVAA